MLRDHLGIEHRRALYLLGPGSVEHVAGHVVGVRDYAGYLARWITREIGICKVLEVTHVLSGVIDDVHLAHIVNPKLSDYDVAHKRDYLAPRIVIAVFLEFKMSRSKRNYLQVLTSEFTRHCELLVVVPVFQALNILFIVVFTPVKNSNNLNMLIRKNKMHRKPPSSLLMFETLFSFSSFDRSTFATFFNKCNFSTNQFINSNYLTRPKSKSTRET